jgi:hypothetical protein
MLHPWRLYGPSIFSFGGSVTDNDRVFTSRVQQCDPADFTLYPQPLEEGGGAVSRPRGTALGGAQAERRPHSQEAGDSPHCW